MNEDAVALLHRQAHEVRGRIHARFHLASEWL